MISTASKILFRTLLSFVVLAVVAVLIVVAALSRGPISLTFLSPYLDQVAADQYPELNFGFDELEMLWDSRDKNLVFAVQNISVTKELETVASIPAVTVTFSAEALLQQRLAPSGFEFTGLKVVLTRTKDGTIKLGYSYSSDGSEGSKLDNEGSAASPDVIHTLLAELGEKQASSNLTAFLQKLEIYNSSLFIEDELIDKIWRVTSTDLVLWKTEEGLIGNLTGDAHFGSDIVSLAFSAAYNRADQTTVINTDIQDLSLPILAKELPELEILNGVSMPVSGHVDVFINPEFKPERVKFTAQAGAGQVDIQKLYKKPLQINSAVVEGHSSYPFTAVNLNIVKIDSIGPQITLSGTFEQTDAGFGMSIEGSFPEIKADDLKYYWPYSAGVDAYDWVTAKISDGYARDVTFRVDLPPGAIEKGKIPDNAIELKFALDNVSADYFAPLPKVTNIKGNAILTEKQIHIFDLSGKVYGVGLPKADVLIYDFDKYDQIADITLTAAGSSSKIFEFIDLKPLQFATPYGIDPARMTGKGVVEAQFVFPLRDDLTLEQVNFEAKGQFENAFIPNVYDNMNVTGADAAVLVTPDTLTVKGNGDINSSPSEFSFYTWFKGEKKNTKRYEVVGKLSEQMRKETDLLNTKYLKGAVGASLAVDIDRQGNASGLVTLNLIEAIIDIPEVRFLKPLGVQGLAGAQFYRSVNKTGKLSNIRLTSENVELVAEASLDQNGLKEFVASKLQFGGHSMSVDLQKSGENSYKLTLNGDRLNLQPLIVADNPFGEDDAETKEDSSLSVLVNLAFGEAILDEGVIATNVGGYVDYQRDKIFRTEIVGRLDGKHNFRYLVRPEGKGRKVEFASREAGLLLKAMDIYDNGQGGVLRLAGQTDDTVDDDNLIGQIKISDMKVYNAPVLGKILTIGSLTGIVELLQNDGMTFAAVEGPFSYKNGVLSTKEFRAVGSVGLTFSGNVDMENETVDGFGTVIPSYTLNSILGNIPLLGTLLTGRKGEGIFGFSYKLQGESENPKITVNPVSALAPGILRSMFFEPWSDAKEVDKEFLKEGQAGSDTKP